MRILIVVIIFLTSCANNPSTKKENVQQITTDTTKNLGDSNVYYPEAIADCSSGYFALGKFAIGATVSQLDCATRSTTYTLQLINGKPQWTSRYGSNFYEINTPQCFICEWGVGGKFSPGGVVGQYEGGGAFVLYICKVVSNGGQPVAKWVRMGPCY